MAFKTVGSSEQVERDAAERLTRDASAARVDHSKRVDAAQKRVFGTLVEPPVDRVAGAHRILTLRVQEKGRAAPMVGVYFLPDHERVQGFGFDDFDDRVRALEVGSEISLGGRWGKRAWNDSSGAARETWEFKTQFFEKGHVPLDMMGERALARIDAATSAQPEASRARPPASPSVSYASGDIVDDRAEVLVNTVNARLSPSGRGVMGKGVALAFSERFPSIMTDYENAIRSGELTAGRALLFDLPDGRKWAALATKDEWRESSRTEWVESGLKELGAKLREGGFSSVAMTAPGCGNGGLDWKEIEPLVHREIGAAGVSVSLYAKPSGAMEPAASVEVSSPSAPSFTQSPRDVSSAGRFQDSPRDVPSAKAKALAAMDGDGRVASSPPSKGAWSVDELVAAVPRLLASGDGYRPYAGVGSRETPEDVADDMTAMARRLEARGFTLRSGFAGGADTAFELGTTRDDRREIFAPWKGFGANPDSVHERQRWNQIRRHEVTTGRNFTPAKAHVLQGAMARRAEELASAHHPAWEKLGNGPRMLHSRNMGQVLGPNLDAPARFEIAYTIDGKASGGTGQAIRVAEATMGEDGRPIPVLNLHDPRIRQAILDELGITAERGLSVEAPSHAEPVRAPESGPSRARGSTSFDLSAPPVRFIPADRAIPFSKVKDENGVFSNMHNQSSYEDGGVTWRSTEAQYQAMRYPHLPEVQKEIFDAPHAYAAKETAYKYIAESRNDWSDELEGGGLVKDQAMAYVLTRKLQSDAFRRAAEGVGDREVVEISHRDQYWGAKPVEGGFSGRNQLGNLETQLANGARMDDLPRGTSFPSPDYLMGRVDDPERRLETSAPSLPDPSLRASMYFAYQGEKRPEVRSDTTFDAILAGERTSTTRFPEWGPLDRYERLAPGQVARFFADKEMKGPHVDVVVTGVERIDLRSASSERLEEWSKAEGWSVQHGRDIGRRHREGVQIRYALPESPEGRAALGRGVDAALPARPLERAAPGRSGAAERPSPAPSRGTRQAQAAEMSAKQRALAFM